MSVSAGTWEYVGEEDGTCGSRPNINFRPVIQPPPSNFFSLPPPRDLMEFRKIFDCNTCGGKFKGESRSFSLRLSPLCGGKNLGKSMYYDKT